MSNTINNNRSIFTVSFRELEERLDPVFYKPEYSDILERNPKWVKVKDISLSIHHPPEYERTYSNSGYQLIRSQNVRPTGLNLSESPVFFSPDFLKKKKVVFPQKGDILIVRSGVNAGDVAVIERDIAHAIIGADNLLLKPNKKRVIPKFIQIYFYTESGRKLLNRYLTGATNKHISPYYMAKVDFPLIDMENQQNCIEIFENGLFSKQQKEKQAQKLIESIDKYLLSELGIVLPEKDKSLDNRIFTTSLGNVSGGRFDPFYYLYCVENPKSTKHKEVKLKEIATIVKGQSITSADIVEGEYPVIAGGQTSPYSHNKFNHEGNIITISASGAYSGFVWYHTSPIFASDCSVVKSKNENNCNTEYLYNVLKLKQLELYNLQQGSGQPHVYPSDIYKIGIPIPQINIQLKINEHIRQIREQAKLLQKEAIDELEKAKNQIEQIILG